MHHRRHFVLKLGVEQGCCAHQGNDGLIAQRDRDRQVLPALFCMRHMDRDIVLRHGLDSQAVRSLDLQTVYSDVFDIVVVPIVKIATDRARLVDEVASVAAVETKERQYLEKIHILLDDNFLPWRALDAFKCARI